MNFNANASSEEVSDAQPSMKNFRGWPKWPIKRAVQLSGVMDLRSVPNNVYEI